jgi:hypothetical protein
MRADEAGTLARVKALREDLINPKVAEHRGRVVKIMGDGVLVEFPSVLGAVACATQIQRTLAERNAELTEDRRIDLRIGINAGDVIVEGDDLYGDGVNIAARMETLAERGGICISAKVFDEVWCKLELGFADLGGQRVKNIPDPIRAYRVLLDPSAVGTVVAARADAPSIAVLPFENLSAEKRGQEKRGQRRNGATEEKRGQGHRGETGPGLITPQEKRGETGPGLITPQEKRGQRRNGARTHYARTHYADGLTQRQGQAIFAQAFQVAANRPGVRLEHYRIGERYPFDRLRARHAVGRTITR